jgi:FKBP-type peptidyl-prolyl cis-trans isomerase
MFKITETGLQYKEIKRGDGPIVKKGQKISVLYDVAFSEEDLEQGITIDKYFGKKRPVTFSVGKGEVLKGIDEGVLLMRVGDLMRFAIPSHLGYGERGLVGEVKIPSNAIIYIDLKVRFVEDS